MMPAAATNRDPLRRPAIACGALIGAALLMAAFGPRANLPVVADGARATEAVSLHFADVADGSVIAADAATGETIMRMAPGEGGFVRSTMRGLAHERLRRGISRPTPFELARFDDGSLVLSDPETGRTVRLNAFGDSNAGAFAALIDHRREPL
jgi:putative photosynthetic complex assembly protein